MMIGTATTIIADGGVARRRWILRAFPILVTTTKPLWLTCG